MRWIKLIAAMFRARFRSKIKASETSSLNFQVWITDIDVSIMNHAAIMTIFEMGRIDFMVRTGFFKLATDNKWYFPNQAISAQFYRPLKMFQRGQVLTKISSVDDDFFYVEQKIIRNGKPIATCFANGMVKKGRETIPTSEIIPALNMDEHDVPKEAHDLVQSFNRKNELMSEKSLNNWDEKS